MEARASFDGSSVSKTFVAAILVLVAMGLGAMGGYVAKGLTGSATSAAQSQEVVKAAPGTVLRQDNPAEVPAWIQNEFPAQGSVLRQDNPVNGTDDSIPVRNQTTHKELP